jgi:hypothetical protein
MWDRGLRRDWYGAALVTLGWLVVLATLVAWACGGWGDVTLGGMLVRCSVAATLGGAISSNMDANFLIACIISDPGCFNGVVGVGCSNACVR